MTAVSSPLISRSAWRGTRKGEAAEATRWACPAGKPLEPCRRSGERGGIAAGAVASKDAVPSGAACCALADRGRRCDRTCAESRTPSCSAQRARGARLFGDPADSRCPVDRRCFRRRSRRHRRSCRGRTDRLGAPDDAERAADPVRTRSSRGPAYLPPRADRRARRLHVRPRPRVRLRRSPGVPMRRPRGSGPTCRTGVARRGHAALGGIHP